MEDLTAASDLLLTLLCELQDLTAASELKRVKDSSRLASLRAYSRGDEFIRASVVLGVEGNQFGIPFNLVSARRTYRYTVTCLEEVCIHTGSSRLVRTLDID